MTGKGHWALRLGEEGAVIHFGIWTAVKFLKMMGNLGDGSKVGRGEDGMAGEG